MRRAGLSLAVALAVLALPARAAAHAEVIALPRGSEPTAGALSELVLRAPNEEAIAVGTKIVLFLPRAVQAGVRPRRTRGWSVRAVRRVTRSAGRRIELTRRLTYTARAGHEVAPGATGAWGLRLHMPGLSGRLCFKIDQHYAPGIRRSNRVDDRRRSRETAASLRLASVVVPCADSPVYICRAQHQQLESARSRPWRALPRRGRSSGRARCDGKRDRGNPE